MFDYDYDSPAMETMVSTAEDCILKSIQGNQDHVLLQLFPTIKRHYSVHPHFELPNDDTNFIPRILYKQIKRPFKQTTYQFRRISS